MGTKYKFMCGECGYEEELSGKMDFGWMAVTQTIRCVDCQRLYDIFIGEVGIFREQDLPNLRLDCPRSRQHQTELWNNPGPCPKCGEAMTRGDMSSLWD